MSDQGQVLRSIDYKSLFPFTHLFRSFRIAIDPSKLILALAALILLYVGGRLLDSVWLDKHSALPNEIEIYSGSSGSFSDARTERYAQISNELMLGAKGMGLTPSENDSIDHLVKQIKSKMLEMRKTGIEALTSASGSKPTDDQLKRLDADIKNAYQETSKQIARLEEMNTKGVFIAFIDYEVGMLNHMASSVVALDPLGAFEALNRFITVGPVWLVKYHTFYAIIFGIFFLIVWAIFGGAISRIAAVQVARDEKISIRSALRFSTGKVLSFLFAPVIPLAILGVLVLVIGLIAGALGWIPFVGPIVIGAGVGLALIVGIVLTLTAVGLLGGFNLMYPSIAIEGSDSFDAVSRSFSYVFDRPWHMAFYTIVALAYGAVTYLFVRLFAFVLLVVTRASVGLLQFTGAKDGSNAFDTIWPAPRDPMNLVINVDHSILGPGQATSAWLVSFWGYLVITLVASFVVSMYFTSNTIIYCLMRKDVDATEMDDVYLEPSDDDFIEPAPATETTKSAETAPAAPATDAGPAQA